MPFVKVLPLFAAVILAVMCSPAMASGTTKISGVDMQKPPDHEAAVRSEFERVKAENKVEAHERFIRRHPGHPLVEEARKALLQRRKQ